MAVRIEKNNGYLLVGMGVKCTNDDTSGIKPLWDKFIGRHQEIKNIGDAFGACFECPGGFDYFAAFEVDKLEGVPEGMEVREIPAARYAVYPFQDTPEKMQVEFQKIFENYMPDAGLKPRPNAAVLERYPCDCWDSESGILKADLMIPIKG